MAWMTMDSAPRDGNVIRLRNDRHAPSHLFYWEAGMWQTILFTIMGKRKACWDPNAAPPTERAAK